MNAITERFAAMAARAARAEAAAATRQPGESEQTFLERAVAHELASLSADGPPPPALDLYEGPSFTPASPDARGRAIAYVSNLIARYQALRRVPAPFTKLNVTAKIEHLRAELGLLQGDSPEGAMLARRWNFLVGDLVPNDRRTACKR